MTLLNGCLLKSVNSNETLDAAHYERVFLYCLAWGIGGLLDVKDRPSFDTELRTLSQAMPQKASVWSTCCCVGACLWQRVSRSAWCCSDGRCSKTLTQVTAGFCNLLIFVLNLKGSQPNGPLRRFMRCWSS